MSPLNKETLEESAMPIAIVGMSCRLPGSADSPTEFWKMLSEGRSGCSEEATPRFNVEAFHHPSNEMKGTFTTKSFYFLNQDVSHFDNQFFGISALEAKSMDPQQRMLLEVAYEAFENAGEPLGSLSGSSTGVYCAVSNKDYDGILGRDPVLAPSYRFTGTGQTMVSNRISYHFDLKGPSITVDTGCSGSLVAIHQACQALRTRQITKALVGATNLILDPDTCSTISRMHFLSKDGRCFAFDSRANGYARGEGIAAIVLKRLDDALREHDPIQAVVRNTGINQDGNTAGITFPDQKAQENLVEKTYAGAGLDPGETCYVETHGTGTPVGDRVEAAAIYRSFNCNRGKVNPLYVGSVKTNIGHTEAASGLAGVIKSVLMIQHGKIPPNLNFSEPNPEIPLDVWGMKVPQELITWPENHIRRVSVNSFAYGGTNGHIIIEAFDEYLASTRLLDSLTPTSSPEGEGHTAVHLLVKPKINRGSLTVGVPDYTPKRHLFVFTHGNDDIQRSARDLKDYLKRFTFKPKKMTEPRFLSNLAYTLSIRRSQLAFRGAVTAMDIKELSRKLDKVIDPEVMEARHEPSLEEPRICFVFTGQGAQWARMGRELWSYPVFEKSMANSEHALTRIGADWQLSAEIRKEGLSSRINQPVFSQPCCTAIQIALVDLLWSWNIRPHAVCGHSSGEIAAAYTAGFITAFDALRIAFYRGEIASKLIKKHPELRGGMLAVGISAEEAQDAIDKLSLDAPNGKAVIACINSPDSVTLSGDLSSLEAIKTKLDGDGSFNRFLPIGIAYHSHHMKLVKEEYLSLVADIAFLTPDSNVQMISSVTGSVVTSLDAHYCAENLVSPVRFSDALTTVLGILKGNKNSRPIDILEIGPHSALKGPITQILTFSSDDISNITYHSILLRNVDACQSSLEVAGELFARGTKVQLGEINDPNNLAPKETLNDLPTYNWQHTTSHWSESRTSSQYRQRKFPRHELLGVPSQDSLSLDPTWRNYICNSELPWLKHHVVDSQLIFPASGYICMVLEALRQVTLLDGQLWKAQTFRFRQVIFEHALIVPDTRNGIETFFTLRRCIHSATEFSSLWKEFRVFSVSTKGVATEHCRGIVSVQASRSSNTVEANFQDLNNDADSRAAFENSRLICNEVLDPEHFYRDLRAIGMDYNGPFANLIQVKAAPFNAFCELEIPDTASLMPAGFQQPHIIHPTTLDLYFQACFPGLMNAGLMNSGVVLTAIKELDIAGSITSEPGTNFLQCAQVKEFGCGKFRANISLGDSESLQSSLIKGFGITFMSTGPLSGSSNEAREGNVCYRLEWGVDIELAKPQTIHHLCSSGVPLDSVLELRAVYDAFARTIVQRVLTNILPEDEERMPTHHRKLLQWMRKHERRVPVLSTPSLRLKAQEIGVEGMMLAQLDDSILEILRGNVDPLSVLTKNGLLYKIYSAIDGQRCTLRLGNFLKRLQFKKPRMRILEIGAGTASATIPLLKALERANLEKYVFTDISSGFFERSMAKLDQWADLIEFKVLDIESPLIDQGFEMGTFDVVIAYNVLHATKSMARTLNNVRDLLKDGGKMCLVEIVEPRMLYHIIGGILPGWWLGEEDGRIDSPLLDTPRWGELLSRNNFSGIDLEMKDYESSAEHHLSLLISTANSSTEEDSASPIHILHLEESNLLSEELFEILKTVGGHREITRGPLEHKDVSGKICIFLLDIVTPFLSSCSMEHFELLKDILLGAENALWVTRGAAVESAQPQMAVATGFIRTILAEDHTLKIVTLDLDPTESCPKEMANQIHTVLRASFKSNATDQSLPEFEYAVRDGTILIPRIVRDAQSQAYLQSNTTKRAPQLQSLKQPGRSLGLKIETPGLLETLYWADSEIHNKEPGTSQVRIETNIFALNFKDLMIAMGQVEGQSLLLLEGSGIVTGTGKQASERFAVGDRVCFYSQGGLATTSNIDECFVQLLPKDISAELGASILVSYATALYALREVAHLGKGESILIHSAAGALGQAAIAVAGYLEVGEIFVTVGSPEKKDLIMQKFGIPEERIFFSHSLSFGAGIRKYTKGKGVDVILNSLVQEAARESHNCLAPFGRFLEVGKKDILSNSKMEVRYLEKNGSFAVIDLAMVSKYRPALIQALLTEVLSMVHEKRVQILDPITVKPISELEDAFREMQRGSHMGKLVLRVDSECRTKVQPPVNSAPKLREDCTYLVVGGLGGIGRATIKLLSELGAKHIATLSRSGAAKRFQRDFLSKMKANGVSITTFGGSVADTHALQKLKDALKDRPVGGIIHAAMALEDSTVRNMTYTQWTKCLSSKTTGTINLQSLFGTNLDFFIILGTIAGLAGSQGQANYGAGSTFQDAFSRSLAALRLPIRVFDLGVVASAGIAAENPVAFKHASRVAGHVDLESVLGLIKFGIANPIATNAASVQTIIGLRDRDPLSQSEYGESQRADAKFSHTIPGVSAASASSHATSSAQSALSIHTLMAQAKTTQAEKRIIENALLEKLSKLLAMKKEEFNLQRTVSSYGVDSLISVELRNWLARECGAQLSIFELMSVWPIRELAEVVLERMKRAHKG